MSEYHKIQTVYLRDPETNYKTLLDGQWARPEFRYLADCEWIFTEKVDGTNIRLIWTGDEAKVGGRTDRAQIPAFLLDRLSEITPKLAAAFGESEAVVYGEGYGARIQKGGGNYKSDGVDFVVFDVRVGGWWLHREDVADVARNLGVEVVPEVWRGSLHRAVRMCRHGFSSAWGDFPAEGLVMRPAIELFGRDGQRVIAKLKCGDFPR